MVELTRNPVADLGEYELQHLAEHLEAAGQDEELHCLLALETNGQRNAWFEAKVSLGDLGSYRVDVERAWRTSEVSLSALLRTQQTEEFRAKHLSLQTRYALVVASLSTIAKKLNPALLSILVEQCVLEPMQGLAYARLIKSA